jgi:hypothetical protein
MSSKKARIIVIIIIIIIVLSLKTARQERQNGLFLVSDSAVAVGAFAFCALLTSY